MLLIISSMISLKTTRDTQGVSVMSFPKGQKLISVKEYDGDLLDSEHYRSKTIPVMGAFPPKDVRQNSQQLKF